MQRPLQPTRNHQWLFLVLMEHMQVLWYANLKLHHAEIKVLVLRRPGRPSAVGNCSAGPSEAVFRKLTLNLSVVHGRGKDECT